MSISTIGGVSVYSVPEDGPALGSERDATDLIGETYGLGADLIVIPVSRLHPDFLRLRTRMAGLFLQKMQNYGYRCAIVGDISGAVTRSDALRDFVYESNKVGQVLFAKDRDALELLLTR
jgi:hypothetical protein